MDFRSAYNREECIRFFRQLFGEEKFNKKDRPVGTHISTKGYFKSIHTLGLVHDLDGLDEDLVILEIEHTSSQDARVALTKELLKLLSNTEIEATYHTQALVIFTNKEDTTYRLSLFTTSYDRTQGVKKILSNPRRQSFLLGQKKIHTATKQLSKKIIDFNDIKKRFSIESVNKDFYAQIAEFFYELTGGTFKKGKAVIERIPAIQYPALYPEKSKNETERKEFGVRLIGRLMFCWFLKQKKVKDSMGLIPSSILSSSAINGPNYYNEFLETLFFEVLNMPQDNRSEKATQTPWSDIPYLNGGLFHPHDNDYYESQKGSVHVPNDWLLRFFEFLELYNFTIDENTTVDQDMSVDPEMLGRIFENLLAEINPETGESARKSTGSFYTPREIVEYMVDETLIQYLLSKTQISETKIRAVVSYDLEDDCNYPLSESEKKDILTSLQLLTIFDPACGSGAYPLGILQKILYILQAIDTDGSLWINMKLDTISDPLLREHMKSSFTHKNTDYLRKLTIIRDTIFGCDIQSIAVETSKLRCFLTLIVDEQIDVSAKNYGIEPLPNLEFKFVCANTLIPLNLSETEKKDINHNVRYKHVLQSQINLNLDEQREIIEELKNIRSVYFSSHHNEKNAIKRRAKELQGRLHSLSIQSLTDQSVDDTYAYEIGKLNDWDIFGSKSTSFFDKSWMFGVDEGFDIIIGNPPYVQVNKGLVPIKQFPYSEGKDKGKQNLYKLFTELSYNLAKDGTGISSYILQSSLMCDISAEFTRELLLEKTKILQFVEFPKNTKEKGAQVFESVLQGTSIFLFQKVPPIDEHDFKLSVDNNTKTIAKPVWTFVRQKDIKKMYPIGLYIPLVSSQNDIQIMMKMRDGGNLTLKEYCDEIRKGDFNHGGSEKTFIIDNPELVPVFHGSNIHRYYTDQIAEDFVPFDFRTIQQQNNENNHFLIGQNITGTTDKNRFHFTVSEYKRCLFGDKVNKVQLKNQDNNYVFLGILNSRLIDWYFRKTSTNNQVNGYELEELPIPSFFNVGSEIGDKLNRVVQKICSIKKGNPDSDISIFEREIDILVFRLYRLTVDEIAVIAPDMVLTEEERRVILGN